MTNNELIEKKKRCLLPALMLVLVKHWTIEGEPQKDLLYLGVNFKVALAAIRDLICHGLLKPEVMCFDDSQREIIDILYFPEKFREAIILTIHGQNIEREFDFKKTIGFWLNIEKGEIH